MRARVDDSLEELRPARAGGIDGHGGIDLRRGQCKLLVCAAVAHADYQVLVGRSLIHFNGIGLIPYVIATALAAVSAYATLIVCAAVAVFYALPEREPEGGAPAT